ncbi:MAG: RHS repeat-associated core domain-containing protein [Actinobacteria bacterium]|nr:RHS repeat-associated core domain-containing protein [Actinomycetota bacterium]
MDGTNAYIYDGALAPAEQVSLSTGTITYLVTDFLGSVRGCVNASGALTATTSYDAWGDPQTTGGLIATTPFGYAGGYTDPTGLLYLINRYYQPSTGQFISVDPEIAQSDQSYEYANGDPVSNTDPIGAFSIRWSWLGGSWYRFGIYGIRMWQLALIFGLIAAGFWAASSLCGWTWLCIGIAILSTSLGILSAEMPGNDNNVAFTFEVWRTWSWRAGHEMCLKYYCYWQPGQWVPAYHARGGSFCAWLTGYYYRRFCLNW